MNRQHAIYLLVTIIVAATVGLALGKLGPFEFAAVLTSVFAYISPSPAFRDISKGDK